MLLRVARWIAGSGLATALLILAIVAARTTHARRDAPRLLVVGWDGASFRMIQPLVEAGRLPNVARLLARGVASGLESTVVPISSAAWTAAATGKGPGETGVYAFSEPIPGTYDVTLASSRSNQAAPLWRILTRRGLRSIVFGVPLTYPPEPILGTLVAGTPCPSGTAYTWPSALGDELGARGYEPDLEPWFELRPIDRARIERHVASVRDAGAELLATEDWDMAWIVFKDLDVASHLAFEGDFAAHVAPLYEQLDAALGALLEAAGGEANVWLVSDHGFHVYGAGFNLHAWLCERGWSVRKEKVKRFAVGGQEPNARFVRSLVRALRNELDWSRTRAFSLATEGNCGGIRLNLAGREPEGSLAPEEAEAVLDRIEADLRALVDERGRKLVRRTWRTAELYPGPRRAGLPDLVFAVDPEVQVFSDPALETTLGPYRDPVPDHDLWGVLVAAGPSIAARAAGDGLALAGPQDLGPAELYGELARRTLVEDRAGAPLPRILDLAPTALRLLGQPVPADMQGRVLAELARGLAPPRAAVETDARADERPRDAPYTEDELETLERRLGALGYR